jgi:myo-inositol-1(or 4)-monophosphatase
MMSIPPSEIVVGVPPAGAVFRPSSFLPAAMTAAQLGGEILRGYFRELKPWQVSEKSKHDLVSEADREAEAAIIGYLTEHSPGFSFLAEESGAAGSSGLRWVIDPLDGTLNFVRGFPHFAVSIALVNDTAIELGVIYDPMRDEQFSAIRGEGACCNGVKIKVSASESLAATFVATGFPYRVRDFLDTYLAVFKDVFVRAGGIRRPGAATLDLAHTASGIFDAFFEFCLAPWDIAAGALLVREAGGVVTNLDGGEDIFSHGNVIAGNPAVHRELLGVVRAHARDCDIHT